jgi:hypothetical protein
VKQTANPHGAYAFQPEKVRAVVRDLSKADRIIKKNNPENKPTYHLQRFGVCDATQSVERAEWHTLGTPYEDPQVALRAAESGIVDFIGGQVQLPTVHPVEPGERY